MAKISICIPYHDTQKTAFYLARLLDSISKQSFTDYEIVLTKEGQFARNHNAAITKATGEYIQMMQMDDYFAHGDALENIVDGLNQPNPMSYCEHGVHFRACQHKCTSPTDKHVWQITACMHDYDGHVTNPHVPKWTDDIYTGNNRLGSVSTLSFKRESALLFEEPLQWLVDCDLYYRLYLKYGQPHLLETTNVVITERPDRLTNTLSDTLKASEVKYLTQKYGK